MTGALLIQILHPTQARGVLRSLASGRAPRGRARCAGQPRDARDARVRHRDDQGRADGSWRLGRLPGRIYDTMFLLGCCIRLATHVDAEVMTPAWATLRWTNCRQPLTRYGRNIAIPGSCPRPAERKKGVGEVAKRVGIVYSIVYAFRLCRWLRLRGFSWLTSVKVKSPSHWAPNDSLLCEAEREVVAWASSELLHDLRQVLHSGASIPDADAPWTRYCFCCL